MTSQTIRCWECSHDFTPLRIQDESREYLASPGVTLESNGKIIATVIRHPKDKHILGLRNETDVKWQATLPEQKTSEVPPGKSIIIGSGIVLDTQSSDAIVFTIA